MQALAQGMLDGEAANIDLYSFYMDFIWIYMDLFRYCLDLYEFELILHGCISICFDFA